MLDSLAFVLTVVCLSCTSLRCLGLVDHLDLGHTAKSIWIIKLEERTKKKKRQYDYRFQLSQLILMDG